MPREIRIPDRNAKVWKTASGDILSIAELEDSHLHNAILMIKRKTSALFQSAYALNREVKLVDFYPPVYWTMVQEATRRSKAEPGKAPGQRTLEL